MPGHSAERSDGSDLQLPVGVARGRSLIAVSVRRTSPYLPMSWRGSKGRTVDRPVAYSVGSAVRRAAVHSLEIDGATVSTTVSLSVGLWRTPTPTAIKST